MSGNFKSILYLIGGACLLTVVVSLFFRILPYVLLVGVIAYFFIKIISFTKKNKEKKQSKDSQDKNLYDNETSQVSSEEECTGEIIDVDFEEVDNNKL